jgi:hypothetical protein
MNTNTGKQQDTEKKQPWWWRLQSGQALVEYWPTLPAAIMVMIAAAAIVMPVSNMFELTSNGLTGVECDVPASGPTFTDLEGGHRIEVTSSVYDPDTDRTTLSFKVSSGSSPSISHWVLGIDEDTADKIIASSEAYQSWGTDPTTGKSGIKFDTGYEGTGGGGKGGGPKKSRSFGPNYNTYVEEREIVLTFTGRVDFVETVETEVTTKAGSDQVSTGYISIAPPSGGTETGGAGC